MDAEVEWRDVPGFEGAYQGSRCGRVRSLDRVVEGPGRWGRIVKRRLKGRQLKIQTCSNRYLFVMLGKGNSFLIHRLVATAFVPGDWTLQVNHKNGQRDDNAAENLEWMTCSDNHRHSYAKLPRKKHVWTTPVTVGGVRYESQLAAARALGVNGGSVSSAYTRGHKCKGMDVT